ncbi:MAG: adenine deaminase [Bacteroidetes bacterium]|nr:adenine deaminase [Bacteroidota bacterium]MBK9798206.1 adenine deaminase [Bacteroidota bacterium]MBP6414323.1 adenine deaminase [Bacteroidia bacterium]
MSATSFQVTANLVDIFHEQIYAAQIQVTDGIISSITKINEAPVDYILPGFVDAHVHVESSMLTPCQFARLAVLHGTVATVSDPHEIGNVLGVAGVEYMIENGNKVPFKFYFGAPSCVPATSFETAGAVINAADIEKLFQREEIVYLAEMMNWPGVLNGDKDVFQKIALAKKYNKQVDGHAPGLRGQQAKDYIAAGISTDHECFTAEEALDKLKYGMKILIREGSAAKNFDALINLLHDYPNEIMFCSDDKHPDNLEEGHLNLLVKRALEKGIDLFKILRAACVNPVEHYKLNVGQLKVGDPADFILVNNLRDFKVLKTYINGTVVAQDGRTNIPFHHSEIVNNFSTHAKSPEQFKIASTTKKVAVIEALDGQLITNKIIADVKYEHGYCEVDISQDILKIAVINRYNNAEPALGFIKNFGLTHGAIASTVAHDSHNIIAVGTSDEEICKAINLLIDCKGGIVALSSTMEMLLPLPIAGIMSGEDAFEVAKQYTAIDAFAKELGSKLSAPFMTLSFMALLVIPHLKLSDKGLFDGDNFEFVKVVQN